MMPVAGEPFLSVHLAILLHGVAAGDRSLKPLEGI
jgi:hypothetical protein